MATIIEENEPKELLETVSSQTGVTLSPRRWLHRLGAEVMHLRLERNLSPGEVIASLRIEPEEYTAFELGEKWLSRHVLDQVAEKLGTTAEEIAISAVTRVPVDEAGMCKYVNDRLK